MTNYLLQFRLAYLRAIAKSWRDEKLREELLAAKNAFDVLADRRFFKDPFISPWPHLGLQIYNVPGDETRWEPETTGGWIGSDNQIIIQLPQAPHDPGDQAEALARYYDLFPTFFGPLDPPSTLGSESSLKEAAVLPLELGIGPEKFREFGGMLIRAIAIGWSGDVPNFLSDLTKPEGGEPTLARYLGYSNPWNFKMIFKIDPDFRWVNSEWQNLGTNEIRIHYPHPPINAHYWAIALTSYNSTGPEYPFTCG